MPYEWQELAIVIFLVKITTNLTVDEDITILCKRQRGKFQHPSLLQRRKIRQELSCVAENNVLA
jgi:hypothetical protein